jgi:hypothetical protein
MARRSKSRPPASAKPKPEERAPGLFPHQLRDGDVITDEHGIAWELLGRPAKRVGSRDYVTTLRRVDRAATDQKGTAPLFSMDTKEGRWVAHERVRVRRA